MLISSCLLLSLDTEPVLHSDLLSWHPTQACCLASCRSFDDLGEQPRSNG